jgi:hypothetical protein
MRKFKLFSMAFAVAAAAFVFTLLQNPPRSVASDPAAGVNVSDLNIPAGLSSGAYDAH